MNKYSEKQLEIADGEELDESLYGDIKIYYCFIKYFKDRRYVNYATMKTNLLIMIIIFLLLPSVNWAADPFSFDQREAMLNISLYSTVDLLGYLYSSNMIDALEVDQIEALSEKDVPFFDRWSNKEYASQYDYLSSYLVAVSLLPPLYYAGIDGFFGWENILVVSEILTAQLALANWTKYLTLRTRPYLYHDNYKIKPGIESRFSFYSAHTSTAFSMAVFNHYYQHHASYRNEKKIWLGYLLAFGVAGCRVAAGKHFFSDVAAGAAAGSLVSYYISRLRSAPGKSQVFIKDNYLGVSWSLP